MPDTYIPSYMQRWLAKSHPCGIPLGWSCFDGRFYRQPPIKFYISSTPALVWLYTFFYLRIVEKSTQKRWHIFTHCTFIPILYWAFIHWDGNGWIVGTAKVEPSHKQRDSQCSPPVGSTGYTLVSVHVSLRVDSSTGQCRGDSHFPISYCTCYCVYLYMTLRRWATLRVTRSGTEVSEKPAGAPRIFDSCCGASFLFLSPFPQYSP